MTGGGAPVRQRIDDQSYKVRFEGLTRSGAPTQESKTQQSAALGKGKSTKTKPILVKDGKLFGDEQGYKRDDVIPDSRLSPIQPTVVNKHVEIIEVEESSKVSGDSPGNCGPNYRVETNRNFLNSEQQFMMTSSFKLAAKGVNFLPICFNLRVHSICHPRSEVSTITRERKLTQVNYNLEKQLRSLIEHMNQTGLILFTELEERVRQNIPVIESKMIKFIADQIQKGLN